MTRWARLPLVLAASMLAGASVASTPAVPGPSADDLATALGAAVGGCVRAADVRWEPSGGALSDLVLGRRLLFLGSETVRGPRDLYRARARLTPEGRVIDLSSPRNLTSTSLGDDHALVVDGDHAAFATFVYGQEQTVTWLDLAGEHPAAGAAAETTLDRLTSYISRVEETGSGNGIHRVEVSLVPPARAVGLSLSAGTNMLTLELVNDAGQRTTASLDGMRGEFLPVASGLHAEVVRHLAKPLVLWAVDTVRASVGPAPIAWLEEHVFAVRDTVRRRAFEFSGGRGGAEEALAEPGTPSAAVPAPLDASGADGDGVAWPPPPIPSIWKTKEAGEGEWQEPRLSWSTRHDASQPAHDSPPPAFYRAFVRPDPDRPYSRVILVAMDTRQLDLSMEAGTEDPKPLTGGHGPGRIPRDPAVASRVVAAFNGGFKTEHGNYGMMVNRRILLPPQPNAATVAVLKDQRVAFGTWGDTHEVTGLRGIPDDDIVSFRQNLDPLVDRGEVNPMGRALWGYTLPGSGMQTERSGLCVTEAGHLLYAWGDDVSGSALGKALKLAGCSYAMHLDMNPHHTGFIFAKINDVRGHNYRSELLTSLMTVSPDRYIEYAPKDFFFVTTRDLTPPPVESTPFHPDPGAQPPPSWSPAIWSTTLDTREGPIDLLRVAAGRARYRIRAGTREPDAKTGAQPLHDLDGDDAHRVVLAVGLGHAQEKHPRGLATDGRLSFPLRGGDGSADVVARGAVLVADADGQLALVRTDDLTAVGTHVDLAELPLVLEDGLAPPDARKAGPASLRGALCIAPDGAVLIARGTLATDAPLGEALARVGCRRAVSLDRGAHVAPAMLRAGTNSPPRGRSEESTLYVLASPMKPRAFRFEAQTTLAQVARTR